MERRARAALRGLVRAVSVLTLAAASGTILPQEAADPAPATPFYTPPPQGRRLDNTVRPRPLLNAVRNAGMTFGEREWGKTTTREIGLDEFTRFGQLFETERIQRLTASFLEGYGQVFIKLPETIIITAVKMSNEEAATDYYRMELEALQIQLDGINQTEDARAEVTLEEEVLVAGLGQGFEKRHELHLEDLPPTRTRVLFGRIGRYTFLITFLQSDADDEAARGLLRDLAERVGRLATAGSDTGTSGQ